jgi:hypothetical protein
MLELGESKAETAIAHLIRIRNGLPSVWALMPGGRRVNGNAEARALPRAPSLGCFFGHLASTSDCFCSLRRGGTILGQSWPH